jgi:hypothetical protein
MSEWGNPLEDSLFSITFSAFALSVLRTESLTKYFLPEYIGFKEQTQGTETSKYLEERKSTDTPLVVASERGPAKPLV